MTFINENVLGCVDGRALVSFCVAGKQTNSDVFPGKLAAFQRISPRFVFLKNGGGGRMKTGANETKTPWWRVTVLPLHFSPVNSTAAGGQQLLLLKV